MDEIYKLVEEFEKKVSLDERLTLREYEIWLMGKSEKRRKIISKELLDDEILFLQAYLEFENGTFDKNSDVGSELYMRLAKHRIKTDCLNYSIKQLRMNYIKLKENLGMQHKFPKHLIK